jgi:hypothetical protein
MVRAGPSTEWVVWIIRCWGVIRHPPARTRRPPPALDLVATTPPSPVLVTWCSNGSGPRTASPPQAIGGRGGRRPKTHPARTGPATALGQGRAESVSCTSSSCGWGGLILIAPRHRIRCWFTFSALLAENVEPSSLVCSIWRVLTECFISTFALPICTCVLAFRTFVRLNEHILGIITGVGGWGIRASNCRAGRRSTGQCGVGECRLAR